MGESEHQSRHLRRYRLWERLAFTSVRDALRGDLSCRLWTERRLAESGLPTAIQIVIASVLHRARLWQGERADVGDELVDHFKAGLAAGRSADELIERFGDPALAAKLIRRAKKRNRIWPVRMAAKLTKAAAIAFVLALIVFSLLLGRLYLDNPDPTHDYLSDLNTEARWLREDERAWPLYEEALSILPEETYWGDWSRVPRPDEPGWDEVVAYYKANQAALDLVREGVGRPGLGYILWLNAPSLKEQSWIGVVPMPHLGSLRRLCRVLSYDAIVAAVEGDQERAGENLLAIMSIARQLRETPLVVSDLVSLACAMLAIDTTLEILARDPVALSSEDLADFSERARQFAYQPEPMVRSEGERMLFADLLQKAWDDDGSHLTDEGIELILDAGSSVYAEWADEAPWPKVISHVLLSVIIPDRRTMQDAYDRAVAAAGAEPRSAGWSTPEMSGDDPGIADRGLISRLTSPLDDLRFGLIDDFLYTRGNRFLSGERMRARVDAARVVIAINFWRRAHGQYPDSLADLVPAFLDEIPRDRLGERPLRYLVRDGQPEVYSVGADGDDDGGMRSAEVEPWRYSPWAGDYVNRDRREPPDGDWILFPPALSPLEQN